MLHEKCGAMLVVSQYDYKQQVLPKEVFNCILRSLLKMLNECTLIWSREDPMSQEGVMIKVVTKTKEKINHLISGL